MNLDATERETLNRLLAKAVCADESEYSDDYTETLLDICVGMFWSKDFDLDARALAAKVRDDLSSYTALTQ